MKYILGTVAAVLCFLPTTGLHGTKIASKKAEHSAVAKMLYAGGGIAALTASVAPLFATLTIGPSFRNITEDLQDPDLTTKTPTLLLAAGAAMGPFYLENKSDTFCPDTLERAQIAASKISKPVGFITAAALLISSFFSFKKAWHSSQQAASSSETITHKDD